MDHSLFELVPQLSHKQALERGSSTEVEVAVDRCADMLSWNLEIKVCGLEYQDLPSVIQSLFCGLYGYVERDVAAPDICGPLHGYVARHESEFV